MADDDILAEARTAGLTIATSAARVADALIRAARDPADQHAHATTAASGQAHQRYEAQAHVAERLYSRAADPGWMRTAGPADAARVWQAAQTWADLDQQRFTRHAAALQDAYRQVYGHDPDPGRGPAGALPDTGTEHRPNVDDDDTPAARLQRDRDLITAGGPDDARTARTIADHLNATHPGTTAATVTAQPQHGLSSAARNTSHQHIGRSAGSTRSPSHRATGSIER